MRQVFCSWSGGKDSCLALDRFLRAKPDCHVTLLTMLDAETGATGAHGLKETLLLRQADALGLDIVFGRAGRTDYELRWREKLRALSSRGVEAGIFGDIDLMEHYTWIERVLTDERLSMVMPLWRTSRDEVVAETLARGYRAMIVSVRTGLARISHREGRVGAQGATKPRSGAYFCVCEHRGEEATQRSPRDSRACEQHIEEQRITGGLTRTREKCGLADARFLGKYLDSDTVAELRSACVDPSGEGGEFHTLVVDGPLFRRAVEVTVAGQCEHDGHRMLELR